MYMYDIFLNLFFQASFGKTYLDETVEALRMKIFLENKKQIEEHNESFKAGQTTFELGLNQFSDMVRNIKLIEVQQ